MRELQQTIQHTINRRRMIGDGARVGVAVSGGADSVALLEALVELGRTRGWQLEVLHLDHCLRGAESDGDREFVETLALHHQLNCHTRSADLRALSGNLEQNARRLRYEFFSDVRRERGLDCVATGHTASDQAETVLLRLMRGASAASLAGIRAVRDGWIVRPLLDVTRDDVRAWLARRGVAWREDGSNEETVYDRNRVRSVLLPLMAREFNPQVEHALARYANTLERDERFWTHEVESLEQLAVTPSDLGLLVDIAVVCTADEALQARFWTHAAARAAGAAVRLDQTHVEALLRLTASRRGTGRVALPRLLAWRSFDCILLTSVVLPIRIASETALAVPGEATLTLHARASAVRVVAERDEAGVAAYNGEVDSCRPGGAGAALELVLRNWRAGDRMRPAGRTSSCKLHDLFEEKRVKAWERLAWPVVACRGEVVWSRCFGYNAEWIAAGRGRSHLRIRELESAPEPMNQTATAWRQNN